MLNGVHILLSYTCLWQCDHCFLHCSPMSGGSFTFQRLEALLDQTAEIGSVKRIAFEGGEPFLLYPLLRFGIEAARKRGFETEVVTNGYWVQDAADAERWLEPLAEAGLNILDVSDDEYHRGDGPSPAESVVEAGRKLGLRTAVFTIDPPRVDVPEDGKGKGEPIVGGGVRFRGRAAEKLAEGLPVRHRSEFTECPDEDFFNPGRVHVDADGNVQLCQGISIGNWVEQTLSGVMSDYDPKTHPVCSPLSQGGPAGLIKAYASEIGDIGESFVDACMACYAARKALRGRFPEQLSPAQAYGE